MAVAVAVVIIQAALPDVRFADERRRRPYVVKEKNAETAEDIMSEID